MDNQHKTEQLKEIQEKIARIKAEKAKRIKLKQSFERIMVPNPGVVDEEENKSWSIGYDPRDKY